MPSGRLGNVSITAASSNNIVYTVPAGKTASFSVFLCNRNALSADIRLALATTSTPNDSEYLEFNYTMPAYSVLERTGLVAQANMNVVVFSTSTGISAMVTGYEE